MFKLPKDQEVDMITISALLSQGQEKEILQIYHGLYVTQLLQRGFLSTSLCRWVFQK